MKKAGESMELAVRVNIWASGRWATRVGGKKKLRRRKCKACNWAAKLRNRPAREGGGSLGLCGKWGRLGHDRGLGSNESGACEKRGLRREKVSKAGACGSRGGEGKSLGFRFGQKWS